MSGLEALGAAASVAGILSLAGESLKAVITLHRFYKDVDRASENVRRFLKDINSLIQILENVQHVLRKVDEKNTTKYILASLQIELDDCNKDVYKWLELAEQMNPASSTGTKKTLKNFMAAIRKSSLSDIGDQMVAHKRNINTALNVLGRHLDIHNSRKLDTITEKVESNTEMFELISSSSGSLFSLSIANSLQLEEISNGLGRLETLFRSQSGSSRSSDCGISPSQDTRVLHSSQDYSYGSSDTESKSKSTHILKTVSSSRRLNLDSYIDSYEGLPDFLNSTQPKRSDVSGRQTHDEFNGPHQFLQKPSPKYIAGHNRVTTHIPSNLSLMEQSEIIFQVQDKLCRCAFDFIAKHQLPIPILSGHRLVESPEDREWSEWVHLLKRLAIKRRIPPQSLYNRRLKELVLILEKTIDRATVKKTSQYLDSLDDWYILQIISSGIRVAQALKDRVAMRSLISLYHATEVKIRRNVEQPEGMDERISEVMQHLKFSEDNILVLRKMTMDPDSLRGWSTKRDQINNWLLESLRCSEKSAELHRSFLADNNVDEKEWARQVLKYWSLDDAATGAGLVTTTSEGAVDSRSSITS